MQMNLDLAKYANTLGKGVSKFLGRVGNLVKNEPTLLKGVDYTKLKVLELSEDVFAGLTKAQKPGGKIRKAQNCIEKFLTKIEQYINGCNVKDLKLNLQTVKS